MARVNRGVSRVQTRRQRQPSSWARLVSQVSVAVPPSTKVLVGTFTLANPGIGETVRRTRGRIHARSDQAAAHEEQLGGFGMIVVSDLAVAAGAASIPDPVSDGSDDGWFVFQHIVASGSENTLGQFVSEPFDSKAMRRVEEGFTVAIMVANSSAVNAFEFTFGISLLSSLS